MKKNITRIYDKKKSNNRRKYMLGIIAILILQIAIYLGAFSRAETVIQVEYVNYYTLETYLSSTDVLSDLNGDYIVLPEVIDNRNVVSYYAEGETNEVKEYIQQELKQYNLYEYSKLVLGCTHFPFFKEILSETFPASIQIIDGSIGVANRLKNVLEENDLLGSNKLEVKYYYSGVLIKNTEKIEELLNRI